MITKLLTAIFYQHAPPRSTLTGRTPNTLPNAMGPGLEVSREQPRLDASVVILQHCQLSRWADPGVCGICEVLEVVRILRPHVDKPYSVIRGPRDECLGARGLDKRESVSRRCPLRLSLSRTGQPPDLHHNLLDCGVASTSVCVENLRPGKDRS